MSAKDMAKSNNKLTLKPTLSNSKNPVSFNLPSSLYWRERLTCKECDFPLIPPVFYCYNVQNIHPLCKNCTQCSVEWCRSKVGTQRSVVIEKILAFASFSCEFQCGKQPVEASQYKNHLNDCRLKPLHCCFCQQYVLYRDYLPHLIERHGIIEYNLDKETMILNLSENPPSIQFVNFESEIFLICYQNNKLWVEYMVTTEHGEVDFRVRVSGVKYDIDVDMSIVQVRDHNKILNENPSYAIGKSTLKDVDGPVGNFLIPPKDEELFILFIHEDDNDTISSIEEEENEEDNNSNVDDSFQRSMSRNSYFV